MYLDKVLSRYPALVQSGVADERRSKRIRREYWCVPTLSKYLLVSLAPSLAVGGFQQQYRVLTPAEAGGIRYTGRPNKEKVWG